MASKSKESLLLPPLSSLPTKQEQYQALRRIKASSLIDENTYCRRALKTTPIVDKTTSKFNKELNLLSNDKTSLILDTTQLNILKKCTETFSSIIRNCPKYHAPLSDIKKGYDSCLDAALRAVEQEATLYKDKLQNIPSHDKSHDDNKHIMQRVHLLEEEAMKLLTENRKLQEILEQEREKMRVELPPMDEVDSPSTRSDPMEGIIDYSDHITLLQQQIFDIHCGAKASILQRSGLVPLSVCQNLEGCIRSSELHIQQLKKQQSTLLEHVEELKVKLQRYFDVLRTSKQEIEELFDVLERNATENINR